MSLPLSESSMISPANQPGPVRQAPFGRYRLRGILAKGPGSQLAIGELPQSEGPSTIVALKQYFTQEGDSAVQRATWVQQAQRSTRLRHPHLAVCHEVGELDGTCFHSAEFLVAEDLHTVLARSADTARFPLEIALQLILQALSSLQAVSVSHGALNPWTLMVGYEGAAKLVKLGLPRPASAVSATAGRGRDKVAYRAPEQLAGAAADGAADVWSAGVLLWECLTGQPLFAGAPGASGGAVLSAPIQRPSSRRAELPPELDSIVLRALERDRSRRFTGPLEMGRALEGFARRAAQPTAQAIGIWMRGMFGAERVTLRRAISQGVDVERSVERLLEVSALPAPLPAKKAALAQSRPLWSTGLQSRTPAPVETPRGLTAAAALPVESTTPNLPLLSPAGLSEDLPDEPTDPDLALPPIASTPPPQPRRWLRHVLAGAVATAVLAASFGLWIGLRAPGAPASESALAFATSSLRIDSTPPGAHILIDGEPSGLNTPAVLEGLRPGRTLEITVHKPGYQRASQQIEVKVGAVQQQAFVLQEGTGRLTLQGAPAGVSLFVDDVAAEGSSPFSLPLGVRRIRVEAAGDVLFFGEVHIRPGEQTLSIQPAGEKP
jgi:eukaryotic-like serine/threonine-protein kinase